ncbi:ROK family transcriptional regulator [Actinomadura kijaniata]|uniref:ROK family transcriptional regulator n=1 Tax=Actinomadura kijaniata TaxID=46161 RepID=UPI003F1D883F
MPPTARPERPRTEDARWRGALAVLGEMRRTPGVTRAAVAQRLGLSSGSATDITARLRDLELLAETPAATSGRGRPTTVLTPHPNGPLVIAVDLRLEDWRCAVAAIDGVPRIVAGDVHASRAPADVVGAVAEGVRGVVERYGDRVRAVGAAVTATVQHGEVVQASTLGWDAVDLGVLAQGLPLVIGNDATLAGVAEARGGAAAGAATALHITIEGGLGGSLVVDGRPVDGATGAGGEFGHLPFGDPALRCPCGATGCWEMDVDGRAIARYLDEPEPADPRTYLLAALSSPDAEVRAAVARAATGFGRGLAGLVNALDPDVVTLGGLTWPLRTAAGPEFDTAFTGGLMRFRRAAPPRVLAAARGGDGALHGAAAVALDLFLTGTGLTAWAGHH